MIYYDHNNKKIELVQPPMAQGGEGIICHVKNQQGTVAKIYVVENTKIVRTVSGALRKKLETMALHGDAVRQKLKNVTWPLEVLYNAQRECVGYIMSKVTSDTDLQPNGSVNKPDNIDRGYKGKTTNLLKIKIAKSLCLTISKVHEHFCVFGDFNPKNVGVNLQTEDVCFFDVDTFQLTKPGFDDCRCVVQFEGYVATELLRQINKFVRDNPKYKDKPLVHMPLQTWTKETDYFALGVHIFHLLMNGEHPYKGVIINPGKSTASPGTPNNSVEQDFYVFKSGKSLPPKSKILPLDSFPPKIRELFNRTFTPDPKIRPTAKEWFNVLTQYEQDLKHCSVDSLVISRLLGMIGIFALPDIDFSNACESIPYFL